MSGDELILELIKTAKSLSFQGNIDAARAKFREAGEALTRKYRRYFMYLAWRSLPSDKKYLAEDIAQDVCLEACRSLQRFDEDKGSLKSWLNGIFLNCRADALARYERQSGPGMRDWEADPDERSDVTVIPGDRRVEWARLEQRINELPDRDRTILMMYAEGMTSPEIAATLHLTPENVRQIIYRSLERLQGN